MMELVDHIEYAAYGLEYEIRHGSDAKQKMARAQLQEDRDALRSALSALIEQNTSLRNAMEERSQVLREQIMLADEALQHTEAERDEARRLAEFYRDEYTSLKSARGAGEPVRSHPYDLPWEAPSPVPGEGNR